MKHLIAAAAAASALALAAPAFAETYVNLGYSMTDSEDVNLGAVTGRLGWKSATPFGVEGEASFGVDDDELGGVKVELDSQWAIYGTATASVSDTAQVFARIGYGSTDIKASAGSISASGSDESWNFGVGGQFFFSGDNGVRADYTRMDFDEGGDADVWSISYVRRFR
jgi:outer membrane immunogenic protein